MGIFRNFHCKQNFDTPHQHNNTIAPLPNDCPFVTGGYCPQGCRFETKQLLRLIEEDVLPDPDVGCPRRSVCGLLRSEGPQQSLKKGQIPLPGESSDQIPEIRNSRAKAAAVTAQKQLELPFFQPRTKEQ